MKSLSLRRAAAFTAAALLWTACSGTGSGDPGTAQTLPGTSRSLGNDVGPLNLSGQYAGTLKDSTDGSGKATASLAQYKRSLGGGLTIAFALGTATDSIALALSELPTVNGTTVAVSKSAYCTFSTSAKYDSKTYELTGSYQAAHGCSGETGTFRLKHQCTYLGGREDVRPEAGPKPC